MTFPSGAPGGYPGQGPYQPPPGPGYGPGPHQGGGLKLSLAQILALGGAGLGVLILFLGFAPVFTGTSFYESVVGWIPALYLISGLLELPAFLPGDDKKPGFLPAVVSVGVTLTYLFSVFSRSGLAAGGVLVLVFGILQTGATVVGYLFEAGIIKPPAPSPYGMAPGGYPPPPAPGFPQTGGFPAQPTTQQPIPQPGVYGGSPGQQTQFAPQQGQFGQPGTPPGGYPQQTPPSF
ncbi:DUF5336 domain-containing protein [Actinocrispum wychmicini]|uniref:34 kDa antigenic protein n=1 Tax=Actinocrispum wychmicini TaxID=1213861 RepID=A0A4R2K6D4_9PSEU|nr:DUF5336 domain-containing protein [Actinocrispum wychmicini]TCO65466.1 hypothetical protein EV192_1011258 [Actinocrispum wychmicini]